VLNPPTRPATGGLNSMGDLLKALDG